MRGRLASAEVLKAIEVILRLGGDSYGDVDWLEDAGRGVVVIIVTWVSAYCAARASARRTRITSVVIRFIFYRGPCWLIARAALSP